MEVGYNMYRAMSSIYRVPIGNLWDSSRSPSMGVHTIYIYTARLCLFACDNLASFMGKHFPPSFLSFLFVSYFIDSSFLFSSFRFMENCGVATGNPAGSTDCIITSLIYA